MKALYLLLALQCLLISTSVAAAEKEVVTLRAVRGRDALLPCGLGKVFLDGPDSFVVWLKNDNDFLFRFPDENSLQRLSIEHVFRTVCEGVTCHDDTALLVKRVGDNDGGVYRCRVHYQASPAVDYVVKLDIVDSPGVPKIYNEKGDEITTGSVGPLAIGSNLVFICKVQNDQPETMVWWERNGVMLQRAEAAHGGIFRTEVRLTNISRNELNAHYECLAQNADVTEPLTASIIVKMFLPPMSVEIRLNNNLDFETGQPRVVDCVVVGCVPPPSITWHLGDVMLRPSVHKELHDGNYTVSSLTLATSLRDNKHELVCRVHNSHLPEEVFEDKVTLNVGLRPVCNINREETIGIVPSETETVTCVVEASPQPVQFSWTFDDTRVLYTSAKKVPGYQHRYSSTLTWQTRKQDIGLLICRATNKFGEQKRPCMFTIVAGGPPNVPECELLAAYPKTVKINCKKNWDGGRPQTIHLEVQNFNGVVLYNYTDVFGHFNLREMNENNVTAIVYASNSRGRSESTILHLQSVIPKTASVKEERPFMLALWIEAGVGTVVVGTGFLLLSKCIKYTRRNIPEADCAQDSSTRSDGTFHREPEFQPLARDERVLANITVNHGPSCQNQYSLTPSPKRSCRVLIGCRGRVPPPSDCPGQHSFYV